MTEVITFKAKPEDMGNGRYRVKFPRFTSSHVDMSVMRSSAIYGGLANSDMLPAMLDRAARRAVGASRDAAYIYSDAIPDTVTIEPGYLHTVRIDISGGWK